MNWFFRYLTSPFVLVPIFTILLFFGGRHFYYHYELGKTELIKIEDPFLVNQLSETEFPNVISYTFSFPFDSPLYGENKFYTFSFFYKNHFTWDVKKGNKDERLLIEVIPLEKIDDEFIVVGGERKGLAFKHPEEARFVGLIDASSPVGKFDIQFNRKTDMIQFHEQMNNLMLWSPIVQMHKK